MHLQRIAIPLGRRHRGFTHYCASVWTQAFKRIFIYFHGMRLRLLVDTCDEREFSLGKNDCTLQPHIEATLVFGTGLLLGRQLL